MENPIKTLLEYLDWGKVFDSMFPGEDWRKDIRENPEDEKMFKQVFLSRIGIDTHLIPDEPPKSLNIKK